jgi:thioredoxin-related protein
MKKTILISLIGLFFLATHVQSQQWQKSWDVSKQLAKTENKKILLNFSGSDWCLPCMRMHKFILSSDEFVKYADQHLILYNADFPRKQGTLTKEQIAVNRSLADKYNSEGHFPLTILLDPDGKVIKEWNGYYTKGVQNFIQEINGE